jgi:CBS domain-containing protein
LSNGCGGAASVNIKLQVKGARNFVGRSSVTVHDLNGNFGGQLMDFQPRESLHLLAARHPGKSLSRRVRSYPRLISSRDPAISVLTDFDEERPCTIEENAQVTDALDQLFLAGGRVLLVVRDTQVVGIVTAEQLRESHAVDEMAHRTRGVIEVMTDVSEVPMMDWQTILTAKVSDLLEIFDATGYRHLVVVESEGLSSGRVRGLIHRGRLATRLRDTSTGAGTL